MALKPKSTITLGQLIDQLKLITEKHHLSFQASFDHEAAPGESLRLSATDTNELAEKKPRTSYFWPASSSGTSEGLMNVCRECWNRYIKERYQRDRDARHLATV